MLRILKLLPTGLALLAVCLALSCGGGSSSVAELVPAGLTAAEEPTPALLPTGGEVDPSVLEELREALFAEFERLGVDPARTPAAAPSAEDNAVFDLGKVYIDPDGEGPGRPTGVELSWTERAVGDYDMNAEVNISDLSPLGGSLTAAVAYSDPALHGGVEWWPVGDPEDGADGSANWRLARIDGDGNGELNIADVTPIAAHWAERFDGYRVYRRYVGAAMAVLLPDPDDPAAPLTLRRSAASFNGGGSPDPALPVRYSFSDTPELEGVYEYYVVPYDETSDTDGTLSNTVTAYLVENISPTASITADITIALPPALITFDASASSDPDGQIVLHEWDFDGDGTYDLATGTVPTAQYTYEEMGTYPATVRVTDDADGTDTASVVIAVVANLPPVAKLTAYPLAGEPPLDVTFSAGDSYDPDGEVVRFEWDFDGDGQYDADTGGTAAATHTYVVSGDYLPVVRVTDDAGRTGETALVNPIVVNLPPTASFTLDPLSGGHPLLVQFDGAASNDADGEIVLYEWDWNNDGLWDGQSDSSSSAAHIYMVPGEYTAALRVTDDDGAFAVTTEDLTVFTSPTAALTADPMIGDAPLLVSFDASGSEDPDGEIVRFEWDWEGDGGYDLDSGLVPTAQYTYPDPGQFSATVRVTDNDGAQATASVVIHLYQNPEADLVVTPGEGDGPLLVSLDASGSVDQDGEIVKFEWDWEGDGEYDLDSGLDSTVQYTYDPGIYAPVVRVTDNDDRIGTASAGVVSHGWRTVTVDTIGDAGQYSSLVVVEGYPAIAYYRKNSHGLCYARALDSMGHDWGEPVRIFPDSQYLRTGQWNSMAVVDGRPAISFYNDIVPPGPNYDKELQFVRANDANGDSWPTTPVVADTDGETGKYTSLAVVDGYPAISYYHVANMDLMYVRATAVDGSTWGTPVTVQSSGDTGRFTALRVVSGNPAIAFQDLGSGDLKYVRASDTTGATWGTVRTLATANNSGNYNSLLIVDGFPAVGYMYSLPSPTNPDTALYYIRANDANGDSWGSPVLLDDDDSVGRWPSLGILDGAPAISAWDMPGQALVLYRAQDGTGSTWGTKETIEDAVGDEGGYTSLLEVDGHAAMSYYDQGSLRWDLKYAVFI